jgi:hypothetical protein
MTDFNKKLPFFYKNLFIPPLSPEHIDKIFANHIQGCTNLTFSVCAYLKELAFCHYQILRADSSQFLYELSPQDLTMYFLGEDAPFALIIAALYISDQRYQQILNQICLPSECDDFLRYNAILQNRAHEGANLIDPQDDSSVLKIFDYLCERPFFPKEEYFVAGCETSKVVYKKALEELNKIMSSY